MNIIENTKCNVKNMTLMESSFFFSIFLQILLSFYFFFYFKISGLICFCLELLIIVTTLLYICKFSSRTEKWYKKEICIYILYFLLIFPIGALFLASSRIAVSMKLKDLALFDCDNFLMGWLWPFGSLSLYLDNNTVIGPKTYLGKIINSILQIFYVIYYLVPYVFIWVILLSRCIKETIYRYKNNGLTSKTFKNNWDNIFFATSVYNLVLFFVFFINTLIPASSPRLYFKDIYTNDLEFFDFMEFTRKIFKDNNSANSFPSGHVAEPFCLALVAFCINENIYGFIGLIISFFIMLSTLVLRYHYFIDIVAALIIALACSFGIYFNSYKKTVNEEFLDEKYEEISNLKKYIEDNIESDNMLDKNTTAEEDNNKYITINKDDNES